MFSKVPQQFLEIPDYYYKRFLFWLSDKIMSPGQNIHTRRCYDCSLEKYENFHVLLRTPNNFCSRCGPRWGTVLDQRPSAMVLLSKKCQYRSHRTGSFLLRTCVAPCFLAYEFGKRYLPSSEKTVKCVRFEQRAIVCASCERRITEEPKRNACEHNIRLATTKVCS